MRKNNAFKSLLSVLFFVLGLFTLTNSAFAEVIAANNSNPNFHFEYSLPNYTAFGLIYENGLATQSINATTYYVRTAEGYTCSGSCANLFATEVDCYTGAFIANISNQSSDVLSIPQATESFETRTFLWTPAIIFEPLKCYFLRTNSNQTDILGDQQGGLQGWSMGISNGSGDSSYYNPNLPFFTLWGNEPTAPTISIDSPPTEMTFTDEPTFELSYTFDETAQNNIIIDILQASDNAKIKLPYTINIYGETSPGSKIIQHYNICNGDYIYQAQIIDRNLGLYTLATRVFTIDIPLNPAECDLPAISWCEGISGTFELGFCRVAEWLFKPDPNTVKNIKTKALSFNDYPPVSYAISFTDELENINATESIQIIPAFIDDAFEWFWWILFILGCYHLRTHLFK